MSLYCINKKEEKKYRESSYAIFERTYKTSEGIQSGTNSEISHKLKSSEPYLKCIWFTDKTILFSACKDELQYLIQELNHESWENGTESKFEQRKDHTQLTSANGKKKKKSISIILSAKLFAVSKLPGEKKNKTKQKTT